jgi:hypothetical protein
MPFYDLKTLPEGLAVTPTMQPVAWAVTGSPQGLVHLCDSYELADRVAGTERLATGRDHRVRPLVYGDRPVAAAAATAADVARGVAETPEPRQVDQSCCGERQEPDAGEGWRELGPDEILQAGDEGDVGVNCPQWVPTQHVGQRAGIMENRYRRRVTPVAQAPQSRLAATWAAAHRVVVEALAAEQAENMRLRSEVERLRLTEEERELFELLANMSFTPDHYRSTLLAMLKRHGGGE